MKRRTWLLGILTSSASFLAGSESEARPGGGSSFKGSSSRPSSGGGSSYRSSSSGGSSYRSSSSGGSSYRSSSSSSSSSQSGSGSSYSGSSASHEPVYAIREKSGKNLAVTAPPGGSPYPTPSPRPAIPMGKDTESAGSKAAGFALGAGLFASITAFLATPLALIGLAVARSRKKKGMDQSWSSSGAGGGGSAYQESPNPAVVRREMEKLRRTDPDFSVVIFEDFLAALYTEAHIARGSQVLERYSPYLRPAARQTLAGLARTPVTSVIVGAMRPYHFAKNDQARIHRVVMEIESNYTEVVPGGPSQAYYACERWTLARAMGTRSRPPNKARALVCPNCGAPLERTVHGRCMYCSQAVDSGQFDWVVERIEIVSRESRGPMLTGTTEEQGTSSPTVFDSELRQRHEELMRVDPSFTRENVESRVRWIFTTMQQAWSSLEWKRARPCLTDRLWNAQIYWIEAYRQQGLRNITENARINDIELVRVTYDRWYQAITVRIHATGLDYTISQGDGRVVGGSKSKERPYTEYWTLVRSTARKHGPEGKPCCPACGAPLPGEMAEKCGHCGALIESSVFDWVLSRIEQDEVYGG